MSTPRPHDPAEPEAADALETVSVVPGAADRSEAVEAAAVPRLLNSPAISASNTKQVRAREAEEDRALIAKAQAGDTVAFRSLVERHQRRAFAIALALVRDENDARELVQDAFLRVFKGLPTFQGGSSFFTWLYRIITNLSIDLIRKPGRGLSERTERPLDADSDSEPDFPLLGRLDGADPLEIVRRQEIGARLQAALDALPAYHRGVIVMREVEGLSYEEMAEVMGVSKGTIMSRLFHARQKLQRALVDCYTEQVGHRPPARITGAGAKDGVDSSEGVPSSNGGDP
jgi:RNA polymerase sigma-70 factor (ECF subfamily)